METKNGIIENVFLGYEGHGLLTCMIDINYGDSSSQGYGGYHLSGEYTDKTIRGLLKTVGVESWDALKKKHVRVQIVNGRITSIGNIMKDMWFSFE